MKTVKILPPNEKQKLFLKTQAPFVAYGGARGGGKSWAVRTKAILLALNYPGIKMLFLRKTLPELRENHIRILQRELNGIATYKEMEKIMIFPNNSKIKFGYCDNESDLGQYQGQEFDIIFMDEATQFSEMQFSLLTACLRGVNDFPKRFYLTCNPGGIGHEWVKRIFIDNPDDEHVFIPARVTDNHAIMQKDPNYIKMLQNLPEDIKRAWLYGDWDIYAGQYFSEFRRDLHVCEPFRIPQYWKRYFALDYGLDMLAGLWCAFDEEGNAYIYREIYQSNCIISQASEKILSFEKEENIFAHLAPLDMWGRMSDTGKTRAEIFRQNGLYLQPVVAQNRVDGWLEIKEYLKGENPKLHIFSNCVNLIRTLPLLQHDKINPSDCATEPHEITHAPDALRYLLAGRPNGRRSYYEY